MAKQNAILNSALWHDHLKSKTKLLKCKQEYDKNIIIDADSQLFNIELTKLIYV